MEGRCPAFIRKKVDSLSHHPVLPSPGAGSRDGLPLRSFPLFKAKGVQMVGCEAHGNIIVRDLRYVRAFEVAGAFLDLQATEMR